MHRIFHPYLVPTTSFGSSLIVKAVNSVNLGKDLHPTDRRHFVTLLALGRGKDMDYKTSLVATILTSLL